MVGEVFGDLNPPGKLLLGAGPSNIHSRVLKAMTLPIVGHLDPYFMEIMDDTIGLLRFLFKTGNRMTLPISGTGTAGMECAITNMVEKGEEVVVCVGGFFGERIVEIVRRVGGKPLVVGGEWGKVVGGDDVERVLAESDAEVVAAVHVETSTGVRQPLEDVSRVVGKYGGFLMVDSVASLGGDRLDVDGLGVDVCFSASQKCLNCPPGLAPITVGERAMEKIRGRGSVIPSWYFDLSTVESYWLNSDRVYHHTAPILLVYALREGLRLIFEEGLEARWLRHERNAGLLVEGVRDLGLSLFGGDDVRASVITAINVPDVGGGVGLDLRVRESLRDVFNICVSGGLGVFKGRLWRVGLMGLNSTEDNVYLFLDALEKILKKEKI